MSIYSISEFIYFYFTSNIDDHNLCLGWKKLVPFRMSYW